MKAATAAEAAKLLILILNGGQGVNRTLDTKIFSHAVGARLSVLTVHHQPLS
jgi:hypothetical protein